MMIPSRYTMTMFAARRYGESIQAIPFSATVRTDAPPSRREEEDMSYRALTPALVVFLMTSPAVAANMAKYSGSIVAVNPAKHTVTLEEVGPWTSQHSTLVKRSVEIGPSTRFELVTRAKATGADGWNGGFTESSLDPSAVRPGDYATATIERAGHQRNAVSVQIVRPANG